MKRLLLLFIVFWSPLVAQDAKKEEPNPLAPPARIQKLFILKYADPQSLYDVLRIFESTMVPNAQMHALAVTASPKTMQSIEEAVNRLDTPEHATKNIDLTMQLVVGSDAEGLIGTPLPKDLDPVVTQLRSNFPFKSYRLLDVLTLRTRERQRAATDSSGGAIQFGNVTKPVASNFGINGSSIGADGTTVRLDGLRAQTKIPVETSPGGQFSYQDLNLSTDVDIKEGQKVVIGRHGISRDQALFLVLSAKVVQ